MLFYTAVFLGLLSLCSGQVVLTKAEVTKKLPSGLMVFIPSEDKCQTQILIDVVRRQSKTIVNLREEVKNMTETCPTTTTVVNPGPTTPPKPDGECKQMTADLMQTTATLKDLHVAYNNAEHELQTLKDEYNVQRAITTESCRRSFDAIGEAEVIYQDDSLGTRGAWMKDTASAEDKVWITKGHTSTSQLLEYKSEASLKSREAPIVFTLPFSCDGMGHIVYKGAFYCNKHKSNIMVRYDLKTGKTVERTLSGAYPSRHSDGHYKWSWLCQIDFEADERGLWVIFAETSTGNKYMAFSKIDPDTLMPLQTWRTSIVKETQGEAFMVCGTLYSTYHYSLSSNYIQYSFDSVTYQQRSRSNIKFHTYEKDHGVASLNYHAKERTLLAWHFHARSLIKYRLLSNFQ